MRYLQLITWENPIVTYQLPYSNQEEWILGPLACHPWRLLPFLFWNNHCVESSAFSPLQGPLWCEITNLIFVSSRSVKMRGFSFLSFHAFWGKWVYFSIFEYKIHSYDLFDIIVHFIIEKLKYKHTFLKKSRNWES